MRWNVQGPLMSISKRGAQGVRSFAFPKGYCHQLLDTKTIPYIPTYLY